MPPTNTKTSIRLLHRLVAATMVVFVAAWLAAGLLVQHQRAVQEQRVARTEAAAEQRLAQVRSGFSRVTLLRQGEVDSLRLFRNAVHVDRAKSLGIPVLQDRAAAELLQENDALVELKSNARYKVQELDYSVPYVTRSTAALLDLIGERFQAELVKAGLPPYRYVVTSVTRTVADQTRLRRVNVNAASTSSHYYGTTVDLHYRVFDYAPDTGAEALPDSLDLLESRYHERVSAVYAELAQTRQQKLKAVLGRVLLQLQREGKVLVIYERVQPVYHITLGMRLAEPAPGQTLEPAPAPAPVPAPVTPRPRRILAPP